MNRLGRHTLLLLVLLAGCSISPVPEPPATPSLDSQVGISFCPTCDAPFTLQAGPGSARDATRIWAVNLDQTAPPVEVDVAEDGSYKLVIVGDVGNEVRLQARRDDLRSVPLDVVLANQGPLAAAPRPLADCFQVITDLDFGPQTSGAKTTRTVTLAHSCGTPLTLSRIALRTSSTAFSIAAPKVPLVMDSNVPVLIDVTFTSQPGAVDEEVLLVETSAPSKDWRAIDLAGRAQP